MATNERAAHDSPFVDPARSPITGEYDFSHERLQDPDGNEDQKWSIVLWNTLYINASLEQLARERHHVTPEDVAGLSPLVFEHINLLGRYAVHNETIILSGT